jgi:hypothetical protein
MQHARCAVTSMQVLRGVDGADQELDKPKLRSECHALHTDTHQCHIVYEILVMRTHNCGL